ncbi:MAG: bifunctional 2-C-methyl-D-erythritol 4-phosphate cytidylyltransferase/2-C-methyl-D-erythritol 2,4-cyclodiphosphate synthase [Alphaproteobacteria bacterium]|nr:bifunctional 2-C-methyl-D-erythritol 4-phosphate cytidylyltransferase/2-C-methyl-D-erythritol 2,4-cyclodiphosphate synthase [Alphaproteobacteria bacterium]
MALPQDKSLTSGSVFLLVASGRGSRAGDGLPKQYRQIAGRSVFAHCLAAIAQAAPGAEIQPVIHRDDEALFRRVLEEAPSGLVIHPHCCGGETRQDSVRAGLQAISNFKNGNIIVYIHDVVRISFSNILIENLAAGVAPGTGAAPGVALADSLRRAGDSGSTAVPRDGLFAVQTPQAFLLADIAQAHMKAQGAGENSFTDDASLAEWAGMKIVLRPGEARNRKITTAEDLHMAEIDLLAQLADIRSGWGYDVHAFCPGDHVWAGGVRIPHSHGLEGHSDADAPLHALTDALLGAIADGDIGVHFPPSDPQWKGARSDIFVREAVRRVRARGGMIAHVDLTIVCEAPRIGPHRDAIRQAVAAMCGIAIDRVSVKATTSEGLGFTGRREGLAASAMASVRLPLRPVGDGA